MGVTVNLVNGFWLVVFLLAQTVHTARTPVARNCLVFGPGLNPDNVIPVRYFYVQAVDKKGRNITTSPGENTFTLELFNPDPKDRSVRAYRQVLDRHDGTFLLRYRLVSTYNQVGIAIKYKGEHVANSPYILKGPLYNEYCNCPHPDPIKWADTMSCPKEHKQINLDFKVFPSIDLKKLRQEAPKRINDALVHYTILDNKLYRRTIGSIIDFHKFSDEWILSVLRKVHVPDVEFFLNLGDWPKIWNNDPIPLISWCGSDDTLDIIMPTYDLAKSTEHAISRETIDMGSVQGQMGPTWVKKISKGFFRGRDSRQERLDLAGIANKHADLLDVGITNWFFFNRDESKVKDRVSFFDFFKYKYQLNIDGTVAAYRFPYLLLGDTVVLKQDSSYYEHFYADLQPNEHYIPVKRDLSNVVEKVTWAKFNDKEARRIAANGQRYARDNLMPDKLYCYMLTLFQEYARRQTLKPKKHKDMVLVEHLGGHESDCQCGRKLNLRKKKKKKVTGEKKEDVPTKVDTGEDEHKANETTSDKTNKIKTEL